MKRFLNLFLLCVCISSTATAQIKTSYFQDTTIRAGSSVMAALQEGNNLYFCGWGLGPKPTMPVIFKTDGEGNEIWNTYQDTALAFTGRFVDIFADNSFIYAFGFDATGDGTYFLAKVSKLDGSLVFLKKKISINAAGIIQIKDMGDKFRMVLYTPNPGYTPSNIAPATVLTFNKNDGTFSAIQPFGMSQYIPVFIDSADNIYYKNGYDSLFKYNLQTASVVWNSKVPETTAFEPGRSITKQNGIIYATGSSFTRVINDATGATIWERFLGGSEFHPDPAQFLKDTMYVTWNTPIEGSISVKSLFAKVNKNTGELYLYGTITNDEGIKRDSGYFQRTKMKVDERGDVYFFGEHYQEDIFDLPHFKRIKKVSGTDGKLIYNVTIPTDSSNRMFNDAVPDDSYAPDNYEIFLFNNKPRFLFTSHIATPYIGLTPVQITYLKLSDENKLNVPEKMHFNNNIYQYPSTVVDIKNFGSNTFVLKQWGEDVFLEKYTKDATLVWQKKIMPQQSSAAQGFAIDSTGNIGVFFSNNFTDHFSKQDPTLTSFFRIEFVGIYNQEGELLKRIETSIWDSGDMYEFLGADDGFYQVNAGSFNYFNLNNHKAYKYGPATIGSTSFHQYSNKLSHVVNSKDSIYVFSGRPIEVTDAFVVAINKQNQKSVKTLLTKSFPYGYILCAQKSAKTPSCVYVGGIEGTWSKYVVTKYDLAKRKERWIFKSDYIGEIFKIIEDSAGNTYAMGLDVDFKDFGLNIIKFNGETGDTIWHYRQSVPYETRGIDLDINAASGFVMAAILKPDTINKGNYFSSLLEISSLTGRLQHQNDIQQSGANTYIHAVKSTGSINTLIGGSKGVSGFLTISSDVDADKCNVSTDFNTKVDSLNSFSFTFSSQSVADSNATYKWSFGDGDSSSGKTVTHTYKTKGIYTASLTVKQSVYCSSSVEKTITVECKTIADFDWKTDSLKPLSVTFINQSTGINNALYKWMFGDGDSSLEKDPSHTYKIAGLYTALLSVKNSNDCRDSISKILTLTVPVNNDTTVSPNDSASIKVIPNPVKNSMKVYFKAIIAGDYTIVITDMNGAIVKRINVTAIQGPNYFTIAVDDLQPGIYLLSIYGSSQTERIRFLKAN